MATKSGNERKDAIWEEMQARGRRRIATWVVIAALVVLLLAGYALRKGLLLDSELVMRPPLQEQVVYLEESEDGFADSDYEIRFAIYHPEENWIQLCFSLPMGESPSRLPVELDYYLDGQEVEYSFSHGKGTWLKNYENIFIENVGEFSELKLVWRGQSIVLTKNE